MNVSVLNEGENIFPFLYQNLSCEGVDFSQNLVVFPGKRPAYFLLNEISSTLKKSFIPPAVFSIEEFIDYCYEEELLNIDKMIDALSATKILKDLLSDKKLFESHLNTLNSFLPLGLKLFSVFEEMLIEGVTKKNLREKDFQIDATVTITNLKRLSDIYDEFYQTIEKNRFSTRSLRYKKVAENQLKLSKYKKIIFAGFFGLTNCEKKIFETFFEDERALFVFQGTSAKDYALNKTYNSSIITNSKIELLECPDTHSQVFKLSELITKELNEKKGESFLIILPSSTTLIPLINALKLNVDDYNISLGYPLVRTPLFSFIKHLFDLLSSKEDDHFKSLDYLNFVLHPYTKNITLKLSSEVTRMLFHAIEEFLNSNRFKNVITLAEIEDVIKDLAKDFRISPSQAQLEEHIKTIHDNTINLFANISNIKDFANKTKRLVNFIYENSTAKKHILFFPYCEEMLSALTELENSLIANEAFNNSYEYFDFFKKFISLFKVPFKGTPIKDVQILGFLESRNLKFDNVYILDVNEGTLPDTQREESILPFDVRVSLGLPTYKEKDILYDYYLNNIISGAKKTVIFYLENDTTEKSRFVEKIIWEKQKISKNLDETFFMPISYKFALAPYKPQPVRKKDEMFDFLKNFTYSASSLDTYFSCPLKFYYQYVLLPRKEDGLAEDLEGKDVGNLVHDILATYFSDKDTAWQKEKFINIVEEKFTNSFGSNIKGEALIIKHQITKRLEEFIKQYENLAGTEVQILELEKELSLKASISDIGLISFKGRIDRIEKRQSELFIIDYKTSSLSEKYKVKWDKFIFEDRENWSKAFKTIQLFFYLFMLKNSPEYDSLTLNASIILLGEKDLTKAEIKLFKEEAQRENLNYIDAIIGTLITEILKNEQFEPTKDLKECKNCDYKDVCWR